MNSNSKEEECLIENKNQYQLKIDGIIINIEYSENKKSLYECMLNILKRKSCK